MRRPLDKRFIGILKYAQESCDVKYQMRFDGNTYIFTEPEPGFYNSEYKDSTGSHSHIVCDLAIDMAEEANRQGLYDPPLDVLKIAKIANIHDRGEGKTGDTSYSEIYQLDLFAQQSASADKFAREEEAMKYYVSFLPPDIARRKMALWYKYEAKETQEDMFVKIMDGVDAAFTVMRIGVGDGRVEPDSVAPHTMKGYGWHPFTDAVIEYMISELKKYFKQHGLEWKRSYNPPKLDKEH